MAIKYKLYQFQGNNEARNGKWYGHVVYSGTESLTDLAKAIEEKCTVHKADITAVLTALVDEINDALMDGQRVYLPGLGTFKVGMSCRPADNRDEFTVARNIKGVHVLFSPEIHFNRTTNTTTRSLLQGAVVKELDGYDNGKLDEKDAAASDSGTQQGSGTTQDSGSSQQGSSSEEEGGDNS